MNKKETAQPYEISDTRIKDLPTHRKPRELALKNGVANVSDEILLAILLRMGIRGTSVIDLARQVLDRHQGSLARLSTASYEELLALDIKGLAIVKSLGLQVAFELGRRASAERNETLPLIRESQHVLELLSTETSRLDQETFWVLMLDKKYRLRRSPEAVTKGTLDACLAHPREVFREAIRMSAAAIIVAHNHPSGDPTPSAEDIRTTRQLVETGRVVGIQVLDHIVIGGHSPHPAPFVSLRDAGLVSFS